LAHRRKHLTQTEPAELLAEAEESSGEARILTASAPSARKDANAVAKSGRPWMSTVWSSRPSARRIDDRLKSRAHAVGGIAQQGYTFCRGLDLIQDWSANAPGLPTE
jgi:hypothetical protein